MSPTRRSQPIGSSAVVAGIVATLLALTGCATTTDQATAPTVNADTDFFNTSSVHSIEVSYDEDDYQAMVEAYESTGDKTWIEATVVIDGVTFENVGLRFKGNSSLMSLRGDQGMPPGTADDGATDTSDTATASDTATDAAPQFDTGDGGATADEPESLPWLIRLDKFVDGQEYQGRTDFVVRGNNSETSLNEAVALYVIGQAGLATEESALTRFSINGGEEKLRLVIESPDDEGWNEDTFESDGITYKAESTGDYSYRGDDPTSYVDVFDQESPDGEDNLTPLIDFLDFINNATDEEFAATLSDHLDVDAFATYLAVQDLVANTDDIDGPGNNSYLRYDESTGLITIVSWDENLAYGGMAGMGGGMRPGGQAPGGQMDGTMPQPPEGMTVPEDGTMPSGFPTDMPEGMTPPDGMGGGMGAMGKENVLVTRFLANADYSALVDEKKAELQASIYDSGDAQAYLDELTAILTDHATDLVDADTITKEADAISAYFTS